MLEAVVPTPDGRWMVGTRNAAGRWALVRWPADTPVAAVVLVESRSVLADPVWTPRGELWFVADPSGFPQVYAWRDVGGGIAQALTAEPLGARSPAPLPDGTLLYSALTAGGWELRRAPALADGLPARFSEPLPFDSAPPLAVPARETGYAVWPSLRPHFWIPFFLNAGPTGRFGGAVTAGTDALHRFTYAADLLLAPQPFRVTGDFILLSDVLGNPTLDFSASTAWLAAGSFHGSLGSFYKVGGVSSGSPALPYGWSFGVGRLFPIRGYRYGELAGRRAVTGTIEYRLPLALMGRSLGHLPVGADRVWLNAFADAGDAWDPGTSPQLTRLRSAGVELAGAVTVTYNLLLQLRLGLAEPLAAPPSGAARRASVYFAFASDF